MKGRRMSLDLASKAYTRCAADEGTSTLLHFELFSRQVARPRNSHTFRRLPNVPDHIAQVWLCYLMLWRLLWDGSTGFQFLF